MFSSCGTGEGGLWKGRCIDVCYSVTLKWLDLDDVCYRDRLHSGISAKATFYPRKIYNSHGMDLFLFFTEQEIDMIFCILVVRCQRIK